MNKHLSTIVNNIEELIARNRKSLLVYLTILENNLTEAELKLVKQAIAQ